MHIVTWNASALNHAFYRIFYPKFFAVNPAGRRLFEDSGIKIQGRALVRMVAVVVKNIDNGKALKEVIPTLGTLFLLGSYSI